MGHENPEQDDSIQERKVLERGLDTARRIIRSSRKMVKANVCRLGEKEACKAHKNRLWTPLLFGIFSICLNPLLLQTIGGAVNSGFGDFVVYSICGLNILSGSLAFMGFFYAIKYYPDTKIVKAGKHLCFFHGIALLILAWPIMEAWSYDMIDWLFTLVQNPLAYLGFVLIFAFLAAVVLPIPVELALAGYIVYLTNPQTSFMGLGIFGAFILISIVMGLGKALGSWIVFFIGIRVESLVEGYMKWKFFQKLMAATQRFCVKFGYLAMYLVMCIPLMTDTVPLYVFSILNKDGDVFELKWFVLSNFWAGIARTLVVGITVVGGVMTYGYMA